MRLILASRSPSRRAMLAAAGVPFEAVSPQVDEDAAKAVCAACPVRQACLEHALSASEPYGIWGGLTLRERRMLRRTRAVERGLQLTTS